MFQQRVSCRKKHYGGRPRFRRFAFRKRMKRTDSRRIVRVRDHKALGEIERVGERVVGGWLHASLEAVRQD